MVYVQAELANRFGDSRHAAPRSTRCLQRRQRLPSVLGESRDDYATTLRKLVWWFRSFKPGELERADDGLYLTLALSRRGVCRHRAYAFVITAHGLGIPARYVSNEAHVFVEAYVPGQGWLRIDLGGGAQGMNVRGLGECATRPQTPGDIRRLPVRLQSACIRRSWFRE